MINVLFDTCVSHTNEEKQILENKPFSDVYEMIPNSYIANQTNSTNSTNNTNN